MTIGTGLGLGLACGMRKVRRESLRAVTAARDRGLLDINTFAVRIGRGQYQCRRGAHRGYAFTFDLAALAELEHLVACDLRVIGGEITRLSAFEMLAFGLVVGLDRQVTTGAAGGP